MKRIPTAVLVLLGAALATGGCGGSSHATLTDRQLARELSPYFPGVMIECEEERGLNREFVYNRVCSFVPRGKEGAVTNPLGATPGERLEFYVRLEGSDWCSAEVAGFAQIALYLRACPEARMPPDWVPPGVVPP